MQTPFSRSMRTSDSRLLSWYARLTYRCLPICPNEHTLQNGLLQAPDVPTSSSTLIITLLPALPTDKWPSGSIQNARIRGGFALDMSWAKGELTSATLKANPSLSVPGRKVEVVYAGKVVGSFAAQPGASVTVHPT